jgi:hypothetical protein
MTFKSYRDESRINYGCQTEEALTLDQLKTGALLRMADATEAMAKNHVQLIKDRDMYFQWYEQEKKRADALERKVRALRGAITRMKKATNM